MSFTEEQKSILASLPLQVQRTLEEFPSVAENFLDNRGLPPLLGGIGCKTMEVYYNAQPEPCIHIEDGVLVGTSTPLGKPARTIEIIDDRNHIFIQVEGHVLLNRMNGNEPILTYIQVEV
jgi:hypothetical protein